MSRTTPISRRPWSYCGRRFPRPARDSWRAQIRSSVSTILHKGRTRTPPLSLALAWVIFCWTRCSCRSHLDWTARWRHLCRKRMAVRICDFVRRTFTEAESWWRSASLWRSRFCQTPKEFCFRWDRTSRRRRWLRCTFTIVHSLFTSTRSMMEPGAFLTASVSVLFRFK